MRFSGFLITIKRESRGVLLQDFSADLSRF